MNDKEMTVEEPLAINEQTAYRILGVFLDKLKRGRQGHDTKGASAELSNLIVSSLTEAEQRGYRLGQEDMRGQTADIALAEFNEWNTTAYERRQAGKNDNSACNRASGAAHIHDAIRALPISPQQEAKPDDR